MSNQVLVVDDDPLMHRLLKHHLERAGYQLLSAANGQEAFDIVSRDHPDLIVMDVMMPEVDGLAALRELRKAEATKTIPVIMITANSHAMAQKEAEVFGAAVFMTKPFSPAQLLTEIRRLLPLNG
jgi:OmpR family response regulator RpaB